MTATPFASDERRVSTAEVRQDTRIASGPVSGLQRDVHAHDGGNERGREEEESGDRDSDDRMPRSDLRQGCHSHCGDTPLAAMTHQRSSPRTQVHTTVHQHHFGIHASCRTSHRPSSAARVGSVLVTRAERQAEMPTRVTGPTPPRPRHPGSDESGALHTGVGAPNPGLAQRAPRGRVGSHPIPDETRGPRRPRASGAGSPPRPAARHGRRDASGTTPPGPFTARGKPAPPEARGWRSPRRARRR